jgi:hypothetical protein
VCSYVAAPAKLETRGVQDFFNLQCRLLPHGAASVQQPVLWHWLNAMVQLAPLATLEVR